MDRTLWTTCGQDGLDAKIDAILRAAGLDKTHVVFSLYETVVDPVRDDMSDWVVRHPAFESVFAEGQVEFVTYRDLGDQEPDLLVSNPYTNPTWADVLIEAERSCRARGAPELDHVYLEAVEEESVTNGIRRYELCFGS